MRFLLEKRIPVVKNMGYSYSRRAQSTLHTEEWKQIALADDVKLFEEFIADKNYRIIEI